MNLNLVFLALGILVAVFGAYFGSFCSKVIFRLENRRMSLRSLSSASICPNCLKKIPFKDKIPIVGYFRLKGKCSHCGAPITKRYLILEIIGMILPFILIIIDNFDVKVILDYFFVMALICNFYISYDEFEFPKPITIFILLLSLIKTEFNLNFLGEMVLSLVISFILAWIIYSIVCKKDRILSSLFFAAAGSYLGLISSLIILFIFLILTESRKFFKVKVRANLILVVLCIIDFAFNELIEQSVIQLITFIFN